MSNIEPARYRRNKIANISKKRLRVAHRVPAGILLEFHYGVPKPITEVGGWHNDPRPLLIVFYDDHNDIIEGINTNYLTDDQLRKVLDAIKLLPINLGESTLDGQLLYKHLKSLTPEALTGYRKYKRKKIISMWEVQLNFQSGQK